MTRSTGSLRRLRLVPSPENGEARPAAPAPALDDSELLTALRAGSPGAASSLHDRVRPIVDRTLARLLSRSDADVDDLRQLAFIEIIDTIESFRGDCPLDAWVSIITARVAFKHFRRRKLERRVFDPSEHEAVSHASPSREVAMQELLRRVRRHLSSLDPARAWTFLLHDVCGYGLKEIAAITDASVAAAQSRLVRGRKEIHERIERDPELASSLEQWTADEGLT